MKQLRFEWLQIGDRGDYLSADYLQRRDPVHVRDDAYNRLDAHAGEPAQPSDRLVHLRAILTDIEGERTGLLDRVVIPTLGLAMSAQDVQLPRDLRGRAQASA